MSSVNLGVNEVILGDDLQNQAAEYRLDYAISTLGSARARHRRADRVAPRSGEPRQRGEREHAGVGERDPRPQRRREVMAPSPATRSRCSSKPKLIADAERSRAVFATLGSDSTRAAKPPSLPRLNQRRHVSGRASHAERPTCLTARRVPSHVLCRTVAILLRPDRRRLFLGRIVAPPVRPGRLGGRCSRRRRPRRSATSWATSAERGGEHARRRATMR